MSDTITNFGEIIISACLFIQDEYCELKLTWKTDKGIGFWELDQNFKKFNSQKMPTHLKEEPMLLLRADDSELFKWVEERLESIGLDGKLYSRVIKSVLNGNLEQEEFELKMNSRRSRGHELLIKEILLASMWKGNDKSDVSFSIEFFFQWFDLFL